MNIKNKLDLTNAFERQNEKKDSDCLFKYTPHWNYAQVGLKQSLPPCEIKKDSMLKYGKNKITKTFE